MPTTYYSKKEWNSMRVFERILKRIAEQDKIHSANRRGGYADNRQYFSYIPYPDFYKVSLTLDHLRGLIEQKTFKVPSFLDVGCGTGLIPAIAREQYYHAHGIEIEKETADIAKDRFDITIYNEDALSFKNYDKFDVIYYYCPIFLTSLQEKLELIIEDTMKVGAYLIPLTKKSENIITDKRFKKVKIKEGLLVYKKVRK